jgi:hypothetical protein
VVGTGHGKETACDVDRTGWTDSVVVCVSMSSVLCCRTAAHIHFNQSTKRTPPPPSMHPLSYWSARHVAMLDITRVAAPTDPFFYCGASELVLTMFAVASQCPQCCTTAPTALSTVHHLCPNSTNTRTATSVRRMPTGARAILTLVWKEVLCLF